LTRRGDERRELAFVQRDVDDLPTPAALARIERHRDPGRRLGPRGVVRRRQRAAHRRAIGIARERGVSAQRDEHEIVRPVVRPRPRAAERRERTPDQAGEARVQRLPAEAQRLERPGRRRLEHDVRARREAAEELAPALRCERQRDAAFARVEGEPAQAALGLGDLAEKGATTPECVTSRRLELDHVGAEVAEDLAGEETGLLAEIENADSVEHASPPQPTICCARRSSISALRRRRFAGAARRRARRARAAAAQRGRRRVEGATGRGVRKRPALVRSISTSTARDHLRVLVQRLEPGLGRADVLGPAARTAAWCVSRSPCRARAPARPAWHATRGVAEALVASSPAGRARHSPRT
jgi:hypothetical protein